MAIDGNEIVIEADVSGTQTLIGSQKGVSIERGADMLDVSTKTSDDAAFIAGKRTSTINCSAFYVVGDDAYGALVTAWEGGSAINVSWSENGGTSPYKSASALVNSLSLDAPAHGPAEIELSLQVTGAWS